MRREYEWSPVPSTLIGWTVRPTHALLATFDQPYASSDGGAIVLKAADRRLGLLAALTATVPDGRASARVTHGIGDLITQRVFAIACGQGVLGDGDTSGDTWLPTNGEARESGDFEAEGWRMAVVLKTSAKNRPF